MRSSAVSESYSARSLELTPKCFVRHRIPAHPSVRRWVTMGDMGYDEDVTRLSRLETILLPELDELLSAVIKAQAAGGRTATEVALVREAYRLVTVELERTIS